MRRTSSGGVYFRSETRNTTSLMHTSQKTSSPNHNIYIVVIIKYQVISKDKALKTAEVKDNRIDILYDNNDNNNNSICSKYIEKEKDIWV